MTPLTSFMIMEGLIKQSCTVSISTLKFAKSHIRRMTTPAIEASIWFMKLAKVVLNVFLRSLMVVGSDRSYVVLTIRKPNKDGFKSHIILYGGEMQTHGKVCPRKKQTLLLR